MQRRCITVVCLLTVLFLTITARKCIAQGSTVDAWITVGPTQLGASPYSLLYYKLFQINAGTDRYASVIDVSIQGDANYYDRQATYRIRIDKLEGKADRFDGLEIRCTSGNPLSANFYIFNDAVWVRSNHQWGNLFYRFAGNFAGGSPLNTAPYGQTVTAPANPLLTLTTGGVKYDFDSSKYYLLPINYVDGSTNLFNSLSLQTNVKVGTILTDQFPYDNKVQPHYGMQWTTDSWSNLGNSFWLSAFGGMKLFTAGVPRLIINAAGNVGIGTTAPDKDFKLAVNGTIGAQRVKVTQQGWADFVFLPEYRLKPLTEVADFIKTHQHLPDIPSAKEVAITGVDLGEMNKKLLQKVEELTLYLIELKKENEQLKMQQVQQNKQLLERIEKLECKR
ncbi:hypothetical protein [Chitinophaga nivalis]|uniref:Peptidase S74 domain-containing protein n=1 Tax=Chitinophaga nivalis TaxID=2991709 RepID=A0ABT3IWA5_9BACT|nr:hypothetical protein [Chitinophaga nivalis]MCW3462060.1 hypothetical protein [Chitinophaga nivalis]MCW3488248.1 hypothetical protein [Chitinophaga nivalis]